MTDAERRERLLETMALKALTRAGWLRAGVPQPESVAAHSWGVAWLALVLCPTGVKREKVLAMAVVHDLPEVRAGDITPHDGVSPDEKNERERVAMVALTDGLPGSNELFDLWAEYDAGKTPEARFVKACDKLDMALQAAVYAEAGLPTREFIDSALKTLAGSDLAALADPLDASD